MSPSTKGAPANSRRNFLLCAGLLLGLLLLLFCRSLDPNEVVFSNDGPYGGMVAEHNRMPAILTGYWRDLNWIGDQQPTPSPAISTALRLVTTPLIYSKIFCPAAIFILGICAWFCFRQWKLSPLACIFGALAAALSSHFFSTACWGVAAQLIGIGMCFVAIGLASDGEGWKMWVRLVLAGMAVGINIMEGYDIGAIFSLFVAAFIMYQSLLRASWLKAESGTASRFVLFLKRALDGGVKVAIVAVFAAICAYHALNVLIGTQIKGSTGETDNMTPEQRWDWATQWSMPPEELPRIFISGLFGYRMDTPGEMAALGNLYEGGVYWGRVGRNPAVDPYVDQYHAAGNVGSPPGIPAGAWRFNGGGEYAGVLVLAVALWALLQSFRKDDSVFTLMQRKLIWFWAGAAFVSLLLALGRYAPFYRLFYMLPHAANIRNASKFMHTFHWCLVILFAYGVHGISKRYLAGAPVADPKRKTGAAAPIGNFEKKWFIGSIVTVAVAILGWLIYASSRDALIKHLMNVNFPSAQFAGKIASFSIMEFGMFVLFLILTAILLAMIFRGRFAGTGAKAGVVLMGALLIVDLVRSDLPWIIYQNWVVKYANNPVLKFLEDKPHEHRVAIFPASRIIDMKRLPQEIAYLINVLESTYGVEWAQHHFQYYNIQAIEDVQRPREAADFKAYERGPVAAVPGRHWELTNTKYLLGLTNLLDFMNAQIDPGKGRFRIVQRFNLDGTTAVPDTNGFYAVFDFTGALPRAKLYTDWQVATNDTAALKELQAAVAAMGTNELNFLRGVGTNDFLTLRKLASPSFDPHQTVLMEEPAGFAPSTNQNPGTVEITHYAPKHVTLKANAAANSILLLNDKYDPNWKLSVDGKPRQILRANFIMRAVQLSPGEHTVQFDFEPPRRALYVSLGAIILGLVLVGVLIVGENRSRRGNEADTPKSAK